MNMGVRSLTRVVEVVNEGNDVCAGEENVAKQAEPSLSFVVTDSKRTTSEMSCMTQVREL